MLMKPDIIVVAINQRFFEHLKALLGSIFTNWPNSPDIIVYAHPDLSSDSLSYLCKFKKIILKKYVPEDLKYHQLVHQNKSHFKSKEFIDTGYFSLQLFSDDFNAYRNLLFLDADTLVLKPLDELINRKSFFICGALNRRLIPYLNVKNAQPVKSLLIFYWLLKLLQFGILPRPFISANSGVMLIPEQLRGNQQEMELLRILRQFQSVCSSDQEIILLYAMKMNLHVAKDYRYNFQLRFLNLLKQSPAKFPELSKAKRDIKVIHFNGPKPDSTSFDTHTWTIGQGSWKALYFDFKDKLKHHISY